MHKLKFTLICLAIGGSQLVQAKNLITASTRCMDSVPSTKWAALVKDVTTGVGCSGVLISPNFALTASSCVNSNDKIIIYPSSGDSNNHPMATGIAVNKILTAPIGDLALLRLATTPQNGITTNEYPVLNYNYQFKGVANCTSPVMGYTHNTDSPEKETYFQDAVQVDGVSNNSQKGGNLIIVNQFSENPPKSDRGGPILIDNKITGINSIDGARYYTLFTDPQIANWLKANGYYQSDCPFGISLNINHADDMDGGYGGDAHISGFTSSIIPVMVRADSRRSWVKANVNPADGSWNADITYPPSKAGKFNTFQVTAQQSTPAGEVCATATKILRVGSYGI